MSQAIAVDDLYRRFGDDEVLRGLTFAVAPGEVFALLGRNGAGKTTAIRILLGFLRVHAGSATILGRPSAELTPDDRDRIGYVAEGHRLYGTMSVAQAIRFEADTRPRFDRAEAERRTAEFGLERRKLVAQLSRGQRAQLALILATAGRPDVLVFDDPAMGLDPVVRRQLLDVLVELLADRGCAVLLSSHILADVERMADRVGILHGGRLIVDATLADLKQRVQKRHWVGRNGHGAEPPAVAGLLRARRRQDGFELTLLDLDAAREQELRVQAAHLSEPFVPDLEELFIDLTGPAGEERAR
jgi:ABC-2 type transport system ATP-binding protein